MFLFSHGVCQPALKCEPQCTQDTRGLEPDLPISGRTGTAFCSSSRKLVIGRVWGLVVEGARVKSSLERALEA